MQPWQLTLLGGALLLLLAYILAFGIKTYAINS